MIHLTLTGYDAGRPLCDGNREALAAAGDTFLHAVYAPIHRIRADVCPDCLEVWDSTENGPSDDDRDRANYSHEVADIAHRRALRDAGRKQ